MKILTSDEDDFIYDRLLELCEQIKLVQSGNALASTLRRHAKVKSYMIEKQKVMLKYIEEKYFDENGVNQLAVEEYHHKTLQNNQHNVY